uniref:Dynactin subunit 1 n=1 Tax=Schistosoma mansoni TaxID=6183 RepID=A0A3Q0KPL2_SCHMA
MAEGKLKIGSRVEVTGKDVVGTIAYIGATQFSPGKWVGVILEESKGKNNGTVQGKRYFTCEENHGIFVRPSQLTLLDDQDGSSTMDLSTSSVLSESGTTSESNASKLSFGETPKRTGSSTSLSSSLKPEIAKGRTLKSSALKRSSLASSTPSVKDKPNLPVSTGRRPPEIRKASQPSLKRPSMIPSTGSNPDLVQGNVAPISKSESPPNKSTESKPVKESIQPSGDTLPKTIPSTIKTSDSKLPTTTDGSKIPEVSTITGASDIKITSQKLELENISIKPKDSSHKIPRSSVVSGVVSSSAVVASDGGGTHSPDTELELTNLRAEITTLHDQIEALKMKREEDKTRIQELERIKIQFTQLEENRRLMREQAAELQREIAQLKTEKAETKEAFDRYRDEVAEMVESVEMATLDKEMAEEKLESLTTEIELLKEQVEELTLENQILKEESEEKGGATTLPGADGGPTPLQLKNLEQQNERMKQALVKLRDLTNQDKQEITALTKQITSLESEINQLQTEKERLTNDLKESIEQTIELKEQVDASLGADTMVSQLTQRNLELEEMLEKVKEERNDLEILCEMNDELQENSRETELELREEIERANTQINQLVRHLDATRETIADYEQTLGKFRDLVADLQTQNSDLQRSLADGKRLQEQQQQLHSTVSTEFASSAVSFMGTKFGATSQAQTLAKVIEAELRRLEAEQSANHVARLSAFLPDSFLRRGGDNEALLALLLIDRLTGKCDLLANHLVERYPLPPCVPGQTSLQLPQTDSNAVDSQTTTVSGICIPGTDNPLPPLTKSKAEFYSFITRLIHMLRSMGSLLNQYKHVDLYLKFGSLYNEMCVHEHCIDRLIEQTKNDQLDETISLESLITSFNYFIQLYTVHLKNEPLYNCNIKLMDFTRTILSAVDALSVDSMALMILTGKDVDCLLKIAKTAASNVSGPLSVGSMDEVGSLLLLKSSTSNDSNEGLINLLNELVHFSTTVRVITRRIKRRIPNKPVGLQPLSFNQDVVQKLDTVIQLFDSIVGTMYTTTRLAGQLTVRQVEDSSNLEPNVVFTQCLSEACKEYLTSIDLRTSSTSRPSVISPEILIRTNLSQIARIISQLAIAMENGEYDFDGTKQPLPQEPVVARAIAYKRAQTELEGCRAKLESRGEELRELQKALKARADELSEMSVRVSLAEKKLETAGKSNEEKISRLELRLEQSESQQKRNEKEYEQTLDALQADIEALEQEKADLKEKLKTLSKKALFEGIIKSPLLPSTTQSKAQPSTTGSTTTTTSAPAPGRQTSVECASPSPGPARLAAYRDASLMAMEIEALREAIRRLSSEVSRLRGEKMLEQLKNLGTLQKPSRHQEPVIVDDDTSDKENKSSSPIQEHKSVLPQIVHDVNVLQKEIFSVLANPQVVHLPKPLSKQVSEMPVSGSGDDGSTTTIQPIKVVQPSATIQFNRQTLQQRAYEAVKTEIPNTLIQADFTSFPSIKMKQLLNLPNNNNETASLHYRLLFPGGGGGNSTTIGDNGEPMNTEKISMTKDELHHLHSYLLRV